MSPLRLSSASIKDPSVFTNFDDRNTAILIRGELEDHSSYVAIVAKVWNCFANENGQLRSLEDVTASASANRQSIMAYITTKLSRDCTDLRHERPVECPRISSRQTDCCRTSLPLLLRAYEHSYPFTQDVVFAVSTYLNTSGWI